MFFSEVQTGSKSMIYWILAFMIAIAMMNYIVVPPNAKLVVSIIMSIVVGLAATLLFGFRLETKIDAKEIKLKIPLILKKSIARDEIVTSEIINYRAFIDFGGWGIRYGKGGIMYNASGNQAVKLVMKDDKIIYIGTSKPHGMIEALSK
jgi:hypothetical protein